MTSFALIQKQEGASSVRKPSDMGFWLCLDSKTGGSILGDDMLASDKLLCLDSKTGGSILIDEHLHGIRKLCLDSKTGGSIL